VRHTLLTAATALLLACARPAAPRTPPARLPAAGEPRATASDGRQVRECAAGRVRITGRLTYDGTCDGGSSVMMDELRCSPCGDGVCNWGEDRCSCPLDCAPTSARPLIHYERSPRHRPSPPGVVNETPGVANIPAIVAAIGAALAHHDEVACDHLPQAERYIFDNGDYAMRAPRGDEWSVYCHVLVANRPGHCGLVESNIEPNLHQDCEFYFRALAEQTQTHPEDCLAGFPVLYDGPDEVYNCMLNFVDEAYGNRLALEMRVSADPGLSPFMIDLYECLELPRPSTQTAGQPDQHHCLYDLALQRRDPKLCDLITNPYTGGGGNTFSDPNCHRALSGAP
jgi:hypothetical protein